MAGSSILRQRFSKLTSVWATTTPIWAKPRIVLQVSELRQEITVDSTVTQLDVGDTENQDKVELTDHLLHDLPLFNQNYLAAVSVFLGPVSIGNKGPSIVVDGLETPEIGISPSAIQEV